MGYDYRYEKPDPDEAARVAVARDAFYAACNERDALPREERGSWAADEDAWNDDAPRNASDRYTTAQRRVSILGDELRDTEESYFRLNLRGGGMVADWMVALGLAFHAGEHPPFATAAEFGLTDDEAWADETDNLPMAPEKVEAKKRYDEAHQAVLTWHGPEIPGIPTHKFAGSNDGWLVLPAEIKAALGEYQKLTGEQVATVVPERYRDLWMRWIAYLRGAVERGGFRTH